MRCKPRGDFAGYSNCWTNPDHRLKVLASSDTRQDRPTLIVVDSHIAWGAPTKQAAAEADGRLFWNVMDISWTFLKFMIVFLLASMRQQLCCRTPSTQGSHSHLAEETLRAMAQQAAEATKHIYNWPDEKFLVPEEVKKHFRRPAQTGHDQLPRWRFFW